MAGMKCVTFSEEKKQEATQAVCASTFCFVSGCSSRTGSSTCTDNKALGREGQLKTPKMDQEKNLHAKENPSKPNIYFLYRDTQVLLQAHNQFATSMFASVSRHVYQQKQVRGTLISISMVILWNALQVR